jgi:glycosyltransferase involved in cell wall biosynthesis
MQASTVSETEPGSLEAAGSRSAGRGISRLSYALITPAKNEEQGIEKTIVSVIEQRLRPRKWIIVDDGSTDTTAAIVRRYAGEQDWIHLVSMPRKQARTFAGKVHAFNAGRSALQGESFDLIGNLDADMLLASSYYANIVAEFERDSSLGLAGGVIYVPIGGKYLTQDRAWDSVGGAVQLFRRECFEQIGGYLPIESGGIDAAAEIMSRMHGWTVRKVAGNPAYEQRRTGYAHGRPWKAAYKEGVHYHRLGYNTLFYGLRCLYRLGDPPFVLGSVLGLAGFMRAKLRGDAVCVPAEVVAYLHAEQMGKIRQVIFERRKLSAAY